MQLRPPGHVQPGMLMACEAQGNSTRLCDSHVQNSTSHCYSASLLSSLSHQSH